MINAHLSKVQKSLEPLRAELLQHPVYERIQTLEDFRIFMEYHVFAVWDFMSQLKALQQKLSCVTLPWVPQGDGLGRRLINEIVVEEESDEDGAGGFASHYELYITAMKEAGASTQKIEHLINILQDEQVLAVAMEKANLTSASKQFIAANWEIVENAPVHALAASFTLGREDLIPDMFRRLLKDILDTHHGELKTLKYYFERHIGLDEDHHTPMAMKMLTALCGEDDQKWKAAEKAASIALKARLQYWDALLAAINEDSTVNIQK